MANGGPVEHGYPHLETVRAAVTALYKRLSYDTVRTFSASVAPADVAFCDTDDLYLGTQRVARELVRHYRLPDARVIVSFREMTHAASVEAGGGAGVLHRAERPLPYASPGHRGQPSRTR